MESGDASNEEAPLVTQKQQSNAKRAVEGDFHMETEDGLRRGAIMVITKN